MISRGNARHLTIAEILEIVSEADILAYYLGVMYVPTLICSPFRRDTRPSLGIFSPNGTTIRFRDFRTGDSGGIFNLLMMKWGCSFLGVLQRITADISKIKQGESRVQSSILGKSIKYPSESKLQIKIRDWTQDDFNYWESFGISKPWLDFGKVVPISHILLERKNEESYIIGAEKHAYAYIENKDNKTTLKIYQPFSKTRKWMSKHDSSVWDLWDQLPPSGDKLILTSSRKDALTTWENTGIPSCSLQSESYLPKKSVIDELKKRFKEIYVLYDNDFGRDSNPGRECGKLLATTFNLKQIELPEEYGCKDPSDFVHKYGREQLKQIINHLIH